jgi:hypothetical protein
VGGRVSSRCPYLRTTRPSGRVNCGVSAKRIGGRQARKRGKEGKPVAQRVTTTTASKNLVGMRRHLTLTRHPAAGGQVREEWPLRCI